MRIRRTRKGERGRLHTSLQGDGRQRGMKYAFLPNMLRGYTRICVCVCSDIFCMNTACRVVRKHFSRGIQMWSSRIISRDAACFRLGDGCSDSVFRGCISSTMCSSLNRRVCYEKMFSRLGNARGRPIVKRGLGIQMWWCRLRNGFSTHIVEEDGFCKRKRRC